MKLPHDYASDNPKAAEGVDHRRSFAPGDHERTLKAWREWLRRNA